MTTWIVFSRDRPAQLDLLLRSWPSGRGHAPSSAVTITVLYRASGEDFFAGYMVTAGRHRRVRFVRERTRGALGRFDPLLRLLIGSAGDVVGFCCDDDVWLYDGHTDPAAVLSDVRLFGFSYRLGRNTVECHPRGSIPQRVPDENPWRWAAEPFESDFGYPFSLDGCVYRRSDLLAILGALPEFAGPNDFEHQACCYVAGNPHLFGGWMQYAKGNDSGGERGRSWLVSSPLNRVNDGYPNPCSDNPEWTPAELNRRFLAGDRLALPHAGFVPRAAHQVIPVGWVASSAATGEGSQPTTAAAGREAIEHPKP